MRTTTRSRSLLAGAALAAALISGGCAAGGGGDAQTESVAEPAAPGERSAAGAAAGDVADAAESSGQDLAQDTGGDALSTKRQAVEPAEQAIIATATVALESDDVAAARFEVQKVVDQVGGTISQEETTTEDDGDLQTARLVLRVPSDRFATTRAALEKVGSLTGSTTESEDVSTQVIDTDARIRSQERSVRRIEALLAAAGTLREIVSIESELSQRQADLDSLKSQQKYLADQTSLSTITVFLEQPDEEAAEKDDGKGGFLGGLEDGWDGFATGLSGAATALGFLLPWLVTAAVLGIPAWIWLRSRRGRRPSPAPRP